MTIRFTLLTSYLLISLASALLISIMTFAHFRAILLQEINSKLQSQATSIIQQIDTGLFERFENMAMWSNLEVMQELRVSDVDKRLVHVINELHNGYGGVYNKIFVVNQAGKVVASTDEAMADKIYPVPASWLTVNHKNHQHSMYPLDAQNQQILFSIPIEDAYKSGYLGRLYASFDWREINRLLDTPLPFASQDTPTYALLLDNAGEIIAYSSKLQGKAIQFSGLQQDRQDSISYLNGEHVLVGYAKAKGYRSFKGLGWQVVILQPSESALRPVWLLWSEMLVYFLLTALLGIGVSLWMSGKIAKPIVELANFTRNFMLGKSTFPPHTPSSREINELNEQFLLMINNLEQSRRDVARVAKLAVIGEMAASMAHEVRTPLGILRSSAQLLEREPNLSEIGLEMTGFILSETQRLNELITTLLACAKPRPPCFISHELHDIIIHTLELIQHQADARHIKIITRLKANPCWLDCDRDQVIQVILNLVINALQHVPDGGHVEVSTDNGPQALLICIDDNGAGIAYDDKNKVFEPFFTQRTEGIGLGLTVVQQIILAHQGTILVDDSPLGGARFLVTLPIVHKEI